MCLFFEIIGLTHESARNIFDRVTNIITKAQLLKATFKPQKEQRILAWKIAS